MADLLDKFKNIDTALGQLIHSVGCNPLAVRMDKVTSPTTAVVNGKESILFGTNNYLGLTYEEDAIEAACQALKECGTGTTGSRVANGSYGNHQDLEKQIADYFGRKHAMFFSTGYQANLGFISAIAGKDDYVLIDSDSHASIYDGCKMGDATVIRFKHNDPVDLEKRLGRLPKGSNKLVIVEGIYSMLGDKAPLKEICEASKLHDAYVLVDEAHSLGVLGETGRGLVEEAGVGGDVDFIIGTFSKSVGTIGGFCVSNHPALESLRVVARSYMFTASPPASIIASASVNLKHMDHRPELMTTLWRNADIFYNGLKEIGYKVGPHKTPVIGVMMPSIEAGLIVWQTLLENGIYVNLALPPATPSGMCLLRTSVCAAHTEDQLRTGLDAYAKAMIAMQNAEDMLLAAE